MKSLLGTASHLIWVAILLAAGGPTRGGKNRPGARNIIRQAGAGHWALLIGVDEYTWARKLEFLRSRHAGVVRATRGLRVSQGTGVPAARQGR